MKKNIFIVIILFIFEANSQHTIPYSSYMISPVLVNPAFAGSDGALSIGLVSRIQLLGIESGNPMANTLVAHTPLINKNFALGTIISYDKFGPQNIVNGNILASGKFKISTFKITLAATAGYTNTRLQFDDKNSISYDNASKDPVYNNNAASNKFNLGLGINVQYKFFFLGVFSPAIKLTKTPESALQKNYFYNQIQIFGGLNYRISDAILIKPSFLVRNVKGSGMQVDINFLANFFNTFTAGASYKINNAIAAIAMIQISPQFAISYSYEHITSNLKTGSMGNHELQLKYVFKYYVNDLNVKKFK